MKSPVKQLLAVVMVMGTAGVASADAPRTLSSQRPACGNTMGKAGPDSVCQWEQTLWDVRSGLAIAEHELRLATPDKRAGATQAAEGWRRAVVERERSYATWKAARGKERAARDRADSTRAERG